MDSRRRWRLALATLAFVSWAPATFVALPFAGLMAVTGPRTRAQWALTLLNGLLSVMFLFTATGDALTAVLRTYIILVSSAFVVLSAVAPARFLRQALRASGLGLACVLVLSRIILGRHAGDMLEWEATRQASESLRLAIGVRPELYAVYEPVVRFIGRTVPAMLVLQAFSGLALAWQWHQEVADRPLGAPLARFRDFGFGDAWVWGLVTAITIWITPVLGVLKTAALNLLVILGAFYLLRGAAIVVAFAATAGVSTMALVLGLAVSAVLAVPMAFILPGLTTLGVSDTWLQFRRRLVSRRTPS